MKKKRPQYRVLMVCMGNICRSPTAQAVLRHKLDAAGLAGVVEVDSAGTTGYHSGEKPDARAIKHAALRGYDLSRLRARQATAEDFRRFDLILAMDEDNLSGLRDISPDGGTARVQLLLDHAHDPSRPRGDGAVPDPYYSGPAGFERVLDLVEHACDGVVVHIRDTLARAPGTS